MVPDVRPNESRGFDVSENIAGSLYLTKILELNVRTSVHLDDEMFISFEKFKKVRHVVKALCGQYRTAETYGFKVDIGTEEKDEWTKTILKYEKSRLTADNEWVDNIESSNLPWSAACTRRPTKT